LVMAGDSVTINGWINDMNGMSNDTRWIAGRTRWSYQRLWPKVW